MTTAHIFRHGETIWNQFGLMQGHQDSELSDSGRSEAILASRSLEAIDFDVAVSSSSGRALETAQLLLGPRPVEIVRSDALREINLGSWEGRKKTVVESQYPEQYQNFWNAPLKYESDGGESFSELWERVTNSMREILDTYADKTILVVSHAASVKAMMSFFAGRSIEQIWHPPIAENLSHSIVEESEGVVTVSKFCGEKWGGA